MADTLDTVLMVMESVFPTAAGGGAESQVRTLSLEFLQQGVPITVVVPMVREGPQKTLDAVEGIPVRRIPYPKLPGLGAMWMLLSLAWLLVTTRRRYSVIHAHIAGNMSAVCCAFGRLLGKPVLVKLTGMTEMRGGILDPSPGPLSRVRKLAMRSASAYQATSDRIARLLVERGFEAGKVMHIPNAVDVDRFRRFEPVPGLRRQLCGERRLVGVYVGRLETEKGLEYLLDGWAQVFRERSDALLLVVGDGRARGALEARCHALGIADQVKFVGPSAQVERFLSVADFGVLTSLHEGLSNTLLEYMAAGLPVLGTEVSGTEDFVITGRTGWLFPPADVQAFARCLGEAAGVDIDELRRRGREARALVDERASIRSVVRQLEQVYARISAVPR